MARDVLAETARGSFELELDSGAVLTLADPTRVVGVSVFTLAESNDVRSVLATLLGEQFAEAWAELSLWPAEETTALLDDVFAHYGAPRRSLAELQVLLGRYGEAIEADLAFATSYRLSQFVRGDEPWATLHNLVTCLQKSSTSYLAAAQATDVEIYAAQIEANAKRRTSATQAAAPELTEVDLPTSLLMGMHELLQQLVHFTAANAPKKTKKPKVKQIPRPVTAKELYERRRTRESYERLSSMLVFDTERYHRVAREHRQER